MRRISHVQIKLTGEAEAVEAEAVEMAVAEMVATAITQLVLIKICHFRIRRKFSHIPYRA